MKGAVVRASLSGGVEIKLQPQYSVEDVKVGNFVTIAGHKNKFISIIGDVKLEASNPKFLTEVSESGSLLAEILAGDSVYGLIQAQPMIMIDEETQEAKTVKTIPVHGSVAKQAEEDDIFKVFGQPDEQHFAMGTPIEMDIPICVNLAKLVERSNGIFGKAGTGKTFLTRVLLAGVVRHNAAVNLVFDAHNEYGWEAKKEGDNGQSSKVKGLAQLFPGKVVIFTLDKESSLRRKVKFEHEIIIPYSQIEPEDIELLQHQLNLSSTAMETIYRLIKTYGPKDWLRRFLKMKPADLEEHAEEIGAHLKSLEALQRKLDAIGGLSFVREEAPFDAIDKIVEYLDKGIHVVIEFGGTKTLGYMLVANILTRRIHHLYVEKMERAIAYEHKEPKPLMISIEEAHRFLSPQLARETIFGTIAREMRKYNVTLLVVDQRTSGIDSEIMSQIGTKMSCQLQDENDVNSLLMGVNRASALKNILASLDSKQQAMILGHAVPMPVVVKTRMYDEKFYREMGSLDEVEANTKFAEDFKDFWG